MKLNKILGVVLSLSVIAGSSSFAMAADGDYFKLGTPIDITTGAEATEIVAGHKIAVPVDVTSTTGSLTSYTVIAKYDSSILSAGFTYDDCSATEGSNLVTLAGETSNLTMDPNTRKYGAVRGMYTMGFGKSYTGSQLVNTAYTDTSLDSGSYIGSNWYNTTNTATTSDPECYLLFTVVGSVSEDSLNTSILEVVPSLCQVADNKNDKPAELGINGEATKVNACDGAFKVVVDSDALPYWVQGVTATINGQDYALDAALNEDGTTSYSFPVRVTSAAEETSVDATIKATVSDDEAGSTNSREVEWGTVTVDMTGTVTDYAQADASIN